MRGLFRVNKVSKTTLGWSETDVRERRDGMNRKKGCRKVSREENLLCGSKQPRRKEFYGDNQGRIGPNKNFYVNLGGKGNENPKVNVMGKIAEDNCGTSNLNYAVNGDNSRFENKNSK
jgi:hypothetical protein